MTINKLDISVKKRLTQKRLKEVLDYNPDTGIFVWKARTAQCVRVGSEAGNGVSYYGYNKIMIDRFGYLCHHLAWLYVYGKLPTEIDHKNHIRNDNRIDNLREVTSLENSRNRSMYKRNTSGFCGVSFSKSRKKWVASIAVKGKDKTLGRFINKSEAIIARKDAEKKYGFHENHGKLAIN